MHPESPGLSRFSKLVVLATLVRVWEHTPRLVTVVVLLTVILAVWIWRRESRPWVRWLGIGAAGLVAIQGVVGGLRVTQLSTPLAIVHACVAQAFLCILMLLAMALSKQWEVMVPRIPRLPPAIEHRLLSLAGWAWVLTAAIYIQLVLGAALHHLDAGLAIPPFPLMPEGNLLPQVHNLMVNIAFAHRFWAAVVVVVGVVVIGRAVGLIHMGIHREMFEKYVTALLVLLSIQLFLGVWVIWGMREPVAVSIHLVNGAVLLMTSFALGVRAWRLHRSL